MCVHTDAVVAYIEPDYVELKGTLNILTAA